MFSRTPVNQSSVKTPYSSGPIQDPALLALRVIFSRALPRNDACSRAKLSVEQNHLDPHSAPKNKGTLKQKDTTTGYVVHHYNYFWSYKYNYSSNIVYKLVCLSQDVLKTSGFGGFVAAVSFFVSPTRGSRWELGSAHLLFANVVSARTDVAQKGVTQPVARLKGAAVGLQNLGRISTFECTNMLFDCIV